MKINENQRFKQITDWIKNNKGVRFGEQSTMYELKRHEFDNLRRGTLIATPLVLSKIYEYYPELKGMFSPVLSDKKNIEKDLIDTLKESKELYKQKSDMLENQLTVMITRLQKEVTERQAITTQLKELIKENNDYRLKIKELKARIKQLENV